MAGGLNVGLVDCNIFNVTKTCIIGLQKSEYIPLSLHLNITYIVSLTYDRWQILKYYLWYIYTTLMFYVINCPVSANCGRWNSPKVPKVKTFKKYYVKSFSTDLSFFTQVMVKDIQTLKCTQS